MSSDNVERLASALEWQPEDMGKARRAYRRNMFIFLIFCLAMAAWIIIEEANNILEARRTGDWYIALGIHFVGQTGSQIIFIAFSYSMARYAPQVRQPQIEAALLTLRAAAVKAHEGIAPHATKVMDGLAQEQVPSLPVQIRRLQRPGRHIASTVVMFIYGTFYSGIIALIGSIGILVFYLSRTDYLWIIIAISGVLLTAPGIILLVWMKRRNRGITVNADETGLHWTLPGWRQDIRSLQWQHAQAFYLVGYLNEDAQQQWAVTLDAPGVSLSWDVAPHFKEESIAASDQLSALILARTGLPLLDLTATAQKLMIEPWQRHYAQTQEGLRSLIPEAERFYTGIPPTTWWREARPAAYIILLSIIVTGVLYDLALGVQFFSR
ncbi:MAG TPA: hypothetical protein VF510_19060 [Ktedonobacterales bacterium]